MHLTPIQIALLAMAYRAHECGTEVVAVWGSWQKAAQALSFALTSLGTEKGTRELEYRTLHGRHRRGKAGRLVHVYMLALGQEKLAARCAWAVDHMPKHRQHVTWKDVPPEIPSWDEGRRCPECLCTPSQPCSIKLPGGGEGRCVPAGMFGFKTCTSCQISEAA